MKSLIVCGKPDCTDFLRTKAQLEDFQIEFEFVNILDDALAAATAQRIASTTSSPVVVFPDKSWLVEPSNNELEAQLRKQQLL